mgnify:FL=1|jgi:hypothetical protein|tara:strand:- start:241 stop:471 length:231 start_codon:yes stop_codon:yes gene_type:complete
MWSIIIATILIDAKEPAMPVIIYSYPTLRACRLELAEIGKKLDYKFVVSPLLGYSLKKDTDIQTTVVFCVQNKQSI